MSDIILHHYPVSHFSEKIRRILAYKNVPWRSVEQPMMMPKPELQMLTGGYRRAPVMQIGADIYCDTACIARRIEQLYPAPACIPPHQASLVGILEDWADKRLGWLVLLPAFAELIPVLPPDIMEDRAKMGNGLTKEAFVAGAPHALGQALVFMARLEQQLKQQRFLLGDDFTLADAACYYGLWLIKNAPHLFAQVTQKFPAVAAWFARIEAFGPGSMTAMTRDESLRIARESKPVDLEGGIGGVEAVGMAEQFNVGDSVAITADDYGREEVSGTLIGVTAESIAVFRHSDELGDTTVHFPRIGYRLRKN